MDEETLNSVLPIVPHDPTGESCGCIVARIEGDQVRLLCNERGATVGTVQLAVFTGLLGLDAACCVPQKEESFFMRPPSLGGIRDASPRARTSFQPMTGWQLGLWSLTGTLSWRGSGKPGPNVE